MRRNITEIHKVINFIKNNKESVPIKNVDKTDRSNYRGIPPLSTL
jgi:hypothetical protein